MRDKIEIGPTPADEPCEQLGPDYDPARARLECRLFIDAIRESLGPEPPGAQLRIASNPHDFGTYYEVACVYDDENEQATEYAFRCESEAPAQWTDEQRQALGCV